MQCPRCFGIDVTPVGTSHYVCNNKRCLNENGKHTQFRVVTDKKVKFPYNQIFVTRPRSEFIKKPYLKIKDPGVMSTV